MWTLVFQNKDVFSFIAVGNIDKKNIFKNKKQKSQAYSDSK